MPRIKRICKDCGTEIFGNINMVMLKQELWKKICDAHKDNICDRCIEIRMDRSITEKDFKQPAIEGRKIISCNHSWLLHRQKMKNNF